MKRLFCALALATSALAGPPAAAQTDAPVRVAVATDADAGPIIDRNVFGQFAEHLGTGIYGGVWVGRGSAIPNVRGIRRDVVAALRDLHVPNVRWPGGCFADEYHWRDGIGPASARRATTNANWGNAPDPNSFGTDEFMDFVDQIGSEAYVSVNVGSGSVREAADWVAYMTAGTDTAAGQERAANGHPAPYRVAMLGIGNESWGCGGAFSPAAYVDQLKLYGRFVRNYNRAQTGATAMKRVAVGPDGGNTAYTEAVMKAWKEKAWSWDIEGLSLHSYTLNGWPPRMPSTGFGERDYAVLLKETLGMDALLGKHGAIMDRYDPAKKVALVVDEWGAWLAPNPGSNKGFLQQQNSQRDAVLAALNLGIFIRHADRVRATAIAQMVNVLQAMILTDGPRMVLTPTYHVYRLFRPFQDARVVPVAFDAGRYTVGDIVLPRVDAVAARDRAGTVWVALINVDAGHAATVDLTGATGATGQTLAAPAVDSVNTFAKPDLVAPRAVAARRQGGRLLLDLPPHSVTVVSLVR